MWGIKSLPSGKSLLMLRELEVNKTSGLDDEAVQANHDVKWIKTLLEKLPQLTYLCLDYCACGIPGDLHLNLLSGLR